MSDPEQDYQAALYLWKNRERKRFGVQLQQQSLQFLSQKREKIVKLSATINPAKFANDVESDMEEISRITCQIQKELATQKQLKAELKSLVADNEALTINHQPEDRVERNIQIQRLEIENEKLSNQVKQLDDEIRQLASSRDRYKRLLSQIQPVNADLAKEIDKISSEKL